MTGVIATIPRVQFSNALGIPLAGGKLTTYLAGTTTPEPTFQDQELTIANPTTITLDATGSCMLWLDSTKNYKFLLKNLLGVTQPGWPVDNISGASTALSLEPTFSLYVKLTTLASVVGASMVGFIQSGIGAFGRKLQDVLREKGVSVSDFMTEAMLDDVVKPTPLLDHTAALRNAIAAAAGRPLRGTRGQTYLILDTLALPSGSDIDLRGATVLDNVQGFWPAAEAGRAKPIFFIYGVEGVKLGGFKYRAAASRATVGDATVPTVPIWIGDNRGGVAATSKIVISDIKVSECAAGTAFMCILGNAFDIDVSKVDITGDCSYGINIEYGKAPTDTDRYGLHPYNINVDQFNGYENKTSVGFLRVASCYNIKFTNCYGKNVRFFTFAWAGDRGISRVSQNVLFENCSSYMDATFLSGLVDYAVQVAAVSKDGSTGETLPSWTNYDHLFMFKGCNYQTNKTIDSAVLRYFGSGGKTIFDACVLQGSFYGVRAEPGGTVTYPIENSLSFRDTVFKNNSRDVLLYGVRGVLFDHVSFKNPDGNNIPIKIQSGSFYNKFRDCNFTGLPTDIPWVVVDAGADYNEFRSNTFEDSAAPGLICPLDLSAPTMGSGNFCSAQGLTRQGAGYYGVLGEEASLAFNMADLPDESVNSKKRTHYFALVGSVNKTIRFITNGNVGDVVTFHMISSLATVTFIDNDASQGTKNRILTKGSANLVATGSRGTFRAYCTETGWLLDA